MKFRRLRSPEGTVGTSAGKQAGEAAFDRLLSEAMRFDGEKASHSVVDWINRRQESSGEQSLLDAPVKQVLRPSGSLGHLGPHL